MIEFGTGGWRAIIGDGFTKANIELVTHAVAALNREAGGKPIVVGYDNRFLSKEASQWICEYLNKCGIDTKTYYYSVPTPLAMWHTKYFDYDYGMMVTASHNPYNYNGIKVFIKGGLDAPKEVTTRLEAICNGIDPAFIPIAKEREGTTEQLCGPYGEYDKELFKMIDAEAISDRQPVVYFDGMNGSASEHFSDLLDFLECLHRDYGTKANPYFEDTCTNTPEPTGENVVGFQNWIFLNQEYVHGDTGIGLIFDGDGDRLMVLDEEKEPVDMNMLLCIFYWYLHEYRHETGAVVKNLATTSRLDVMAKHYGEACYEVPVGFKYITENMKRYNALIGGESSGGFTYRGHVYGKDSTMAALLVLEIISKTGMKLTEIVSKINKEFGRSYEISEKYPLNGKTINFMNLNTYDGATRTLLDGVKFTYPYGWLLIRPSGTEPIARIMVEADTENHAQELLACGRRLLALAK